MGHEGAEVTGGGVRNPDRGEALVLEQIEPVLGVPAVGLGLAHDPGADLGGLAHQKGMTEARHEFVKPPSIAGTLDADSHWARQRAVELLDGIARVEELLLHDFAGVGVENRDLLFTGVQITSDDCHESGPPV